MYYLENTKEYGRHLVASKDLIKDTLLAHCELLVLNAKDTVQVNLTDLKYYTFKYNEVQDCLVLGDGEIFNHSDSANVSYTIEIIDDRPLMCFRLLKDVSKGEGLFINYNADCQVDTSQYINHNLV